MMINSEHRNARIRHKLSYLSKTIAPPALALKQFGSISGMPNRKLVFLQLNSLLDHLPENCLSNFEQFNRLHVGLKKNTPKLSLDQKYTSHIISLLTRSEKLSDYNFAYTAAICTTPTQTLRESDQEEKFYRYQSLVILSCLKLHIVGQHDSAIQNALREIRLIATDGKHMPLLNLLPDLSTTITIKELVSTLGQLRKQDPPPTTKLLMRGLGYIYVALNDSSKMAKGILRYHEARYVPARAETLNLIAQDPIDETDQRIFELSISVKNTKKNLDESDEPLSVKAGKVIKIEEPSSRHKSQALRAVQSKRLAEQLSVRQLSLPCDFEQASEWDIQNLVSHTVNLISANSEQAQIASLLLLSLFSGRHPEQFTLRKSNLLLEIKHHPCIQLIHSIPAGKQSPDTDKILKSVGARLIIPLPAILKGRLTLSHITSDMLRSMIKEINNQHTTRLTLGRIVRYMEHWYINQGMDRAEIALIKGESVKARPALSYSNLDVDLIIEHHKNYVESLYKHTGLNADLPALHPTGVQLGSRLVLPRNVLHNLFNLISPPELIQVSNQLDEVLAFHNRYVVYVCTLLTFSTGHRDVTAPMGQLTDYNQLTQIWWISDKEIRHGLAARIVVLPATAAQQVKLYLEHLQALEQRTRFSAPSISERCQRALSGADNLLFAIIIPPISEIKTVDLTPSLLDSLFSLHFSEKMPFARNWGRHHLRSQLKRLGVSPELIDGWMGHEEIGEEALGRHSSLSLDSLGKIANKIEEILKEHHIKALPGWKTH